MLNYVKNEGVEAIEIGIGENLGEAHCNVDECKISFNK